MTGGYPPGGGVGQLGPGLVAEPPPLAQRLFGDRLGLCVRYAQWLVGAGVERGLIGPHEAARLWERHLLNCVAVGAMIPPGSRVIDIGSGAGLPGIVLAIARPDLQITLLEPMLRRTTFLEVVAADLGLDDVDVRRARAEDLTRPRLRADIVTARAVAPVARLGALSAPLLRPGGQLLAIKGAGVAAEVASGWAGLRRAAMTDGAALFVVAAAPQLSEIHSGWLPGAQSICTSTWASDGTPTRIDASEEAPGDTGSEDALAVVLRLTRSH
jgi:16S rRNA (guanine527-N7)-methyltransferase